MTPQRMKMYFVEYFLHVMTHTVIAAPVPMKQAMTPKAALILRFDSSLAK
jgi:hypothetical protein